jgi:hypothetical protein
LLYSYYAGANTISPGIAGNEFEVKAQEEN